MSRDGFYIAHILESIGRIESYVEEDRNKFFTSNLVQDAVIRNLQILAESTTRLSDEFKNAHPEIEWSAIKGLRNILVHGYLNMSLKLIWEIIEKSLPSLRTVMENNADSKQTGNQL